MQLYPGAFQIQSNYGGRNLFQYLLVGDRTILIDSGIADTPENTILPYIERRGLDPRQLSMVITTHPDGDHQGGNATLRSAIPEVVIACGEADRELVEDPRHLYGQRYNHLRTHHGLGFEEEPSPHAGAACKIDIGFRGGERIMLSNDWELEVLHLPGHSSGHLALYDRANRAAFVSDAVHGHGCPKADGGMAIPVTYYHLDTYLTTIRHLEELPLEALYTGHWPIMRGEEIADFLADSRHTVERLDRAILHAAAANRSGRTLVQFIEEALGEFPEWPVETSNLAMFSLKGHLDRLEQEGKLRLERSASPYRWLYNE